MTDPAVQAAQLAWERKYGSINSPWREGFPNRVSRGFVDSAREMAKPIRDLIENWDVCHEAREMALLKALAPLVYSTDELPTVLAALDA